MLYSIDLFAWCGWLTDWFRQTGYFSTLAAIEWDKSACETLWKRMISKWFWNKVYRYDIQKVDNLIKWWDDEYGKCEWLDKIIWKKRLDVIIWWPPCQAYSLAWRIRDENGMEDDYRNYLFRHYLEIVNHYKPKLFVFENVPWLFSAKPKWVPIIEEIRNNCKEIWYTIYSKIKEEWIFNAVDYWVPQIRKRVVIIWVNNNLIKWDPDEALENFYNVIMKKYRIEKIKTVKDALSDMTKFSPVNSADHIEYRPIWKNNFLNNIPRNHNNRDYEIFKDLAIDAINWHIKYKSTDDLINLYYEKTWKKTNVHKYHVLERDSPSTTIPAHLYKDWLRHIHPDPKQWRSITVREAARLQSFDDDFEFIWSMWDQFKMIWNAVPPKFAKAIWLAVNDFIKKYF